MNNDLGFTLNETSDSDGCLRISEVNKGDSTLFFGIKILFTEETVLKGDSSGLVDETKASEASNFGCVEKGLSFDIREIGRDRKDNISAVNFGKFVELLHSSEVKGHNLFDCKRVLLTHLGNLEAEFLVVKLNCLGCGEFLLMRNLLLAASIETKETHGVKDSVLHVAFNLELDGVTDKSLLFSVCDLNTTK